MTKSYFGEIESARQYFNKICDLRITERDFMMAILNYTSGLIQAKKMNSAMSLIAFSLIMGYNIVRLLQFNTLNRNRLKRRNKDSYRQEDKITYRFTVSMFLKRLRFV